MVSQKEVRRAVSTLLPTVDLSQATQRSVRSALEDQLGEALGDHKSVIKWAVGGFGWFRHSCAIHRARCPSLPQQEEIESYLLSQSASSETAASEPPQKKARVLPQDLAAVARDASNVLWLNGAWAAVVHAPPRSPAVVDFQRYELGRGELRRQDGGFQLGREAWQAFTGSFQELSSQLQRRVGGPDVATNVGPPLQAACVVPSEVDASSWSICLKTAHSKTSVLLSAAEWETLVSGADQVSRALQRLETLGVGSTSEAPSSRPPSTDISQVAAACCVQLAAMRQAEVSSFRGAPLLNVREFYEQSGQKLPGKKGLALSREQAEALLSFAPRLSAALQARETTEPLELSQKKRVAVSEFKGRVSVDLREYWEKDGEMVPGRKGISLPADQWNVLCSNLPKLIAALKSA